MMDYKKLCMVQQITENALNLLFIELGGAEGIQELTVVDNSGTIEHDVGQLFHTLLSIRNKLVDHAATMFLKDSINAAERIHDILFKEEQ